MKSQKDGKSYLTDALDTGLLLCEDKDKLTVEWSLKNVNAPIGVASYKVKNAIQWNNAISCVTFSVRNYI